MATWAFYGWTAGEDTAFDASSAIAISSDSALSFGGGVRADFQTNITLNTWNSAMHLAEDTTEATGDTCTDMHLWPLSPTAADFTSVSTGAVLDGVYVNMAVGTPEAARGIGARFTHGFGVKCNPVTIWAGTANGATLTNPQSCYVAFVDLTSADPTWATARPGNKYTLKIHGTESEEHWWNVGIAVQPLIVGHNGSNELRIETTYY